MDKLHPVEWQLRAVQRGKEIEKLSRRITNQRRATGENRQLISALREAVRLAAKGISDLSHHRDMQNQQIEKTILENKKLRAENERLADANIPVQDLKRAETLIEDIRSALGVLHDRDIVPAIGVLMRIPRKRQPKV
jgi:cell division protein FtsB